MTHQDLNDAADTLNHAARKVAENSGEAMRASSSDAIHAATSGISEVARLVGAAIRDEATLRAEEGKDLIAEHGRRLASDLLDAAADQGEDNVQSRVLQTIASAVADASEILRQRSVADILADTQNFARSNPGVFVAGAALAGFALARLAIAASRPVAPETDEDFRDKRQTKPAL
ncbi:MAG: hypothetical protein ABIV25_06145 [Paracoccaceae bacterium]